jgi:hypothetical protein
MSNGLPGGIHRDLPRAARQIGTDRSRARGSLLWTTWTSPETTRVGQDSIGETSQTWVRIQPALTIRQVAKMFQVDAGEMKRILKGAEAPATYTE